jgi:hypothetical protein
MCKRIIRVLCGMVGATILLIAQPLAWCLIACTVTCLLLLLIYVFGPDKYSDRIARLLRLPHGD